MAAVSVPCMPVEPSASGGEPTEAAHKKKVLVLGATGNVGRATVRSLIKSGFSVVACSRDPNSDKAKAISGPDVHIFAMFGPGCVKAAASGCDSAVVIPPSFESRGPWAVEVMEHLRALGLTKVVLVSLPGAKPDAEFRFGQEFGEMEKALRDKGITPCIIRLPMFMENLYGSLPSVKRNGTLPWRPKADAQYTPVAVADIGDAVAAILSDYDAHKNKDYTLCAPPVSARDIAQAVGRVLGKPINVVEVSDAEFLEGMHGLGVPPWQASGVLELMKLVDEGNLNLRAKDLQTLLGRAPTTLEDFVNGEFKRALLA